MNHVTSDDEKIDEYISGYGAMYSKRYDAIYDKDTGEWLEEICEDDQCLFCHGRPPKMMLGVLKIVKGK